MKPRAVFAFLLLSPLALAAPPIAYDGFLEIDGVPAEGAHDVTLRVLDDSGAVLVEEDVVVDVAGGRFTARVGPLPDGIAIVEPLFVALEVDGVELDGQQELLAVPFAGLANGASSALDRFVVKSRQRDLGVILTRDGSGGFTAQTWILQLGEDGGTFNLVDVTGLRRPLIVQPGAPTATIGLDATGRVGLGTEAPQAHLHLLGIGGNSKLLIEETSATNATRELLELRNNGGIVVILDDTTITERWSFGTNGGSFVINNQSNAGIELLFSSTGNLTLSGTLTQGSDRRLKKDFVVVDDALDRLLQVHGYAYTRRATGARELGVIAQEVEAVFPEVVVRGDDGMLAVSYVSLVAPLIEAVRELDDERQASLARIRSLEEQLEETNARLARIERALQTRR
ncbi:MAG: tail fiber domain-containing protein [Deltaproteobacteria bacterium]|nr:tail fiber domain-containing protein [Deltaproteobacteria bacterium]